jgi:predicted transport protein
MIDMGEINLFRIDGESAEKLTAKFVELEKSLQTLIEKNMDEFFGIRFLASEYSTGIVHGGRIDSLGIDENNSPVILEYKRSSNENVINQGLYYLDWLLDHRAEFELLVMKRLGSKVSEKIDWDGARLLCIAGDYNKYDEYAVKQINRNIELIRYRKYDDLLLFELVNATQATLNSKSNYVANSNSSDNKYKSVSDYLKDLDGKTAERYQHLKDYIMTLGDDVFEKETKYYIAFKKIKNFVTVTFAPREGLIYLYLKLDPNEYIDHINQYPEMIRNVKDIGHWGTGDIEVKVRSDEDLDVAKQLILESYEMN